MTGSEEIFVWWYIQFEKCLNLCLFVAKTFPKRFSFKYFEVENDGQNVAINLLILVKEYRSFKLICLLRNIQFVGHFQNSLLLIDVFLKVYD